MKNFKLLIIVILLINQNNYFMQERTFGGLKEIYLRTVNLNETDSVFVKISAQGNVWAWKPYPPYNISNTYNGYSLINSENSIIGNYEGWEKGWESLVPGGAHQPPYYSYGIYKFLVKKGYNSVPFNFYINFRDSDWDGSSYPSGNDIYLYFNGVENSITINWGFQQSNSIVGYGQLFNFWTEKGKNSCSTSNFSDFWENCLVAIPENCSNCSNLFYVPHLIWGPKPNYTASGYKIYRSQNNKNNYQMIQNISNPAIFEYVDESLYSSADTSKYYYKVTAYSNSGETEPTNEIEVQYLAPPKNITLSWENNYLKISWERIALGNVDSYYIYKSVDGSSEILARTEPQQMTGDRQAWIDYNVTKPKRTDPMFRVDYRIRTKTMDDIFSN